jgi:hypothetical protein
MYRNKEGTIEELAARPFPENFDSKIIWPHGLLFKNQKSKSQ